MTAFYSHHERHPADTTTCHRRPCDRVPRYFTGWRAANHWALTEQTFRTTVVKTTGRVRASSVRLLDHDYLLAHVPSAGLEWGIETVWRGEMRLCIADPARTVVDSLDAPRLGGGIRHVAEILAAYLDDNEPATLIEYGDRLGNRIARKRSAWPQGTVMIPAREILNLRAEWSLDVGVIEKDYVLGWLLAGITNHPKLSPTWVFKGGTCLRKCY